MSRVLAAEQFSAELRQSRLAEPPLEGFSHLTTEERNSLAPMVDSERRRVILEAVTTTISALCRKLHDKLNKTSLLGPDTDWFCRLFVELDARIRSLSEATERAKATYVRAIDAKLRGDVEAHLRDKSKRVRTVGGFIIQTLQELLDVLETKQRVGHEFLWTVVASLRFIFLDMLAWVVYCDDPNDPTWGKILDSRGAGIDDFDRRVAQRRGISLHQKTKPEFEVRSRRPKSDLASGFDELMKAHPWPY